MVWLLTMSALLLAAVLSRRLLMIGTKHHAELSAKPKIASAVMMLKRTWKGERPSRSGQSLKAADELLLMLSAAEDEAAKDGHMCRGAGAPSWPPSKAPGGGGSH